MIAMTRNREQSRIMFGPLEWSVVVTLFLAVLGGIVGGYEAYLAHDRNLTVLQTEMVAVKIELAEARGDLKQLIGSVSALDALIREHRAEAWPDAYSPQMERGQ
jgi:hypothetical protein